MKQQNRITCKNSKTFKLAGIILLLLIGANTIVSATPSDDRFKFVIGPRIGMTYMFIDRNEFDEALKENYPFSLDMDKNYMPLTTLFALNLEQRILLGRSKNHFCFQEIIGISGVEQALIIPTAAIFLAYRADFGLEVGVGPLWTMAGGLSVAYAVGWTFSFDDVYVPLDVVFVPDFNENHHRLTISTGFNFDIRKRNR